MPLNAGDRQGGYEVIALFGEGPSTHSTSSGSTVGGVEPSASALSTGAVPPNGRRAQRPSTLLRAGRRP